MPSLESFLTTVRGGRVDDFRAVVMHPSDYARLRAFFPDELELDLGTTTARLFGLEIFRNPAQTPGEVILIPHAPHVPRISLIASDHQTSSVRIENCQITGAGGQGTVSSLEELLANVGNGRVNGLRSVIMHPTDYAQVRSFLSSRLADLEIIESTGQRPGEVICMPRVSGISFVGAERPVFSNIRIEGNSFPGADFGQDALVLRALSQWDAAVTEPSPAPKPKPKSLWELLEADDED